MSAPLVSLGICGWRPEPLRESIESCLAQTYEALEVIVADDRLGELEPIVSAVDDPRVRYHRNERRRGVAGNARLVSNLARGAYLGLPGDDDILKPEFVARCVDILESDPSLGIVFTDYFLLQDDELLERGCSVPPGKHEAFLRMYMAKRPVLTSATLMRREVWTEGEAAKPLPEDVAADLWTYMRAAEQGWPFYYLPERLVVYRVHEQQTSRDDTYRRAVARAYEGFAFTDEDAERSRRGELARTCVDRAAALLRSGEQRQARNDLRRARELDASAYASRRRGLTALALVPALVPVALRVKKLVNALRRVPDPRSTDRWRAAA